jgi:hypothetical protein
MLRLIRFAGPAQATWSPERDRTGSRDRVDTGLAVCLGPRARARACVKCVRLYLWDPEDRVDAFVCQLAPVGVTASERACVR